MHKAIVIICAGWISVSAFSPALADHYVAQNGQAPVAPYTNWAEAASNIQDAVNAAAPGALVLVSNGTYYVTDNPTNYSGTNVVFINRSLTLRGYSGNPADVIINGGGSNRCVQVLWDELGGLVRIENMTLTNGYGLSYGGGIYFRALGDAASGSTGMLAGCVISGNTAAGSDTDHGGGGVASYNINSFVFLVSNCLVRGNTCTGNSLGGGIYVRGIGLITDSEISANQSVTSGGGIHFRSSGATREALMAQNCLIISNSANGNGGGVYQNRSSSTVRNCLIAYNTSVSQGGAIYGYEPGTGLIENCTIVSNYSGSCGGFTSRYAMRYEFNNVIMYGNTAGNAFSNIAISLSTTNWFFNHCCTAPLATSGGAAGTNNFNTDPDYLDRVQGNFRLAAGSPCINAGTNLGWMAGAKDLDRHRRIDPFFRLPDVGCYEDVPQGMLFNLR